MLFIGNFTHISFIFYNVDEHSGWGLGISRSGILATDFLTGLCKDIKQI